MKTITLASAQPTELLDITNDLHDAVTESGIEEGVCSVFCLHTTACMLVNENEPGLKRDFEAVVRDLLPQAQYRHDCVDNNARSHLTAGIIGGNLMIPVHEGRLVLGTWQSVFFVELDGPRPRRSVAVQVIPCNA
ncbi:MAG: secondary thiamine-phosphate synthase enzyme YjbQ [Chloroflexi bacterium]|nr:secondary thiamine-phosphate synthase enzyme YjbQ [Chloroflexota bacterium]